MDQSAYDEYLEFKYRPDSLLDVGLKEYLTFSNNENNTYWTESVEPSFGETWVETSAKTDDNWGEIKDFDNNYDCMGKCGAECLAFGGGRDCMEHDVCSYFKSLALMKTHRAFVGTSIVVTRLPKL